MVLFVSILRRTTSRDSPYKFVRFSLWHCKYLATFIFVNIWCRLIEYHINDIPSSCFISMICQGYVIFHGFKWMICHFIMVLSEGQMLCVWFINYQCVVSEWNLSKCLFYSGFTTRLTEQWCWFCCGGRVLEIVLHQVSFTNEETRCEYSPDRAVAISSTLPSLPDQPYASKYAE